MCVKLGNEGLGVYWRLIERLCRQEGRLEDDLVGFVSRQFGYPEKKFRSLLDDFGLFERYESGYCVPAVVEHLKERASLIEKRMYAINSRWKNTNAVHKATKQGTDVSEDINTKAETKPYTSNTCVGTDEIQRKYKGLTELELDKELEKENTLMAKSVDFAERADSFDFDGVWKLYGRRGNKKESHVRWSKLPQGKRELALKHIPLYVAATPNVRYRKHFEAYLANEVWNDELPIPDKGKGNMRYDGEVRLYTYHEMSEMVTSGKASSTDEFSRREKGGTIYWVKVSDIQTERA
jgi:hypothetical protein